MSNKKLPSVTSNIPRDLRTFIDRVRDLITGNTTSRLLSAQDLIDAGLADGAGGGSIGPLPPAQSTVTPPAPTGLTATAAIRNIILEWAAPTYPGHAYAEVWGSSTNSLGTAVKLGMSPGSLFVDAVGPGFARYYWIRFVNIEDVAGPYNGVSGTFAETQQEPAYLLEVLTGEITESQLYDDLNARINLIDGDVSLVNSVDYRVNVETTARVAAVSEVSSALDAEEAARIAADIAEASARADGIAIESHTRLTQVTDAANAALEAVIVANDERVDRLVDTADVRQELTYDLQLGLSAEAASRLELTTVVNQNAANIVVSQTALSTLDSSTASSLSTLVTQVNNNLAAIQNEVTARTDADSAEAATRDLLAVQLRGDYTGSDLGSLASGLIYQERVARVTEDASLAQQITLLSAGSGDQFDWKTIWYFDTGIESWTGNGTPTATAGWLRPANAASDAYVESPTNVGADGAQYGQVRMRIRKTGTPTFAGYLWWRASGDTTWDTARRVALDEPTYDGNGIGLITATPGWSVLVDRIRIDLSSAQTATDYFELDWVAVGRPSPGASFAQLLLEQEARTSADDALSQQILTLDASVGDNTALITEEALARASTDSALAAQTSLLTVAAANSAASLYSEAVARADADGATSSLALSLVATTQANAAAIASESSVRTNENEAIASSVDTLTTTVAGNTADIETANVAISTLDSALATQTTTLVAFDKATKQALDNNAEALLRDALSIDTERTQRELTLAYARQELSVDIQTGLSAEASARLELAAIVDDNTAAIDLEQTARATQDEALASSIASLTVVSSDTAASLVVEQNVRATADEATSAQITTLAAGVQDSAASLVVEQNVRATADEATSAQIMTLAAGVQDSAASLVVEQNVRATADEATSAQITTLAAGVQDSAASLVVEQNVRATADEATSAQITTLAVSTGSSAAAIAVEQQARADNDGAISGQLVTVSSTVDEHTTTIQQNTESIDGIRGQYTVKIDNNGFVSGFGLASNLIDGGTATSEFYVNVDKFAVTAPASSITDWAVSTSYAVGRVVGISGNTTKMLVCKIAGTSGSSAPSIAGAIGDMVDDNTVRWQIASRVPFAVVSTESTVNGVTVPPGIYVDGAMIVNATVQNAQIANAAVDDNKIADVSAGKITAGSIDVDSYIQSTEFISGTQGWRIDGNGSAEFGAASIRGQLTAAQIDSRELTIKDASGTTIFSSVVPLDFSLVGGTTKPEDNATVGAPAGTNVGSTDAVTVESNASNGNSAYASVTDASTGLATKLANNARNVLSGGAGLAIGSLQWNSSGVRTSGYGVGITSAGIAAYNSSGTSTFSLNGSDGSAVFGGTVTSAGLNGGDFTGYAWPASGGTGFHLSPSGLLLGNYNDGKYVHIYASGNFYIPGLRSVDGTLYVDQLSVINTLNLAGNAVTVPLYATNSADTTGGAVARALWIYKFNMPQAGTALILWNAYAEYFNYSLVEIYINGVLAGSMQANDVYDERPLAFAFGSAVQGENTIQINTIKYNGFNDQRVYDQTMVIWSAMR